MRIYMQLGRARERVKESPRNLIDCSCEPGELDERDYLAATRLSLTMDEPEKNADVSEWSVEQVKEWAKKHYGE